MILGMADLATRLGLGNGLGASGPMSRALGRLVWFDVARRAGDTLAVRVVLPDVPARRPARLSASARFAHQHLADSARHPARPAAESAPAVSPAAVGL